MSKRQYARAVAATVHGPWTQEAPLSWPEFVRTLPEMPCYLAGVVDGKRKTIESTRLRSVLTLDEDKPSTTWCDDVLLALDAHASHPTKSSRAEALRYRLLVPLSRDVDPEEYYLLAQVVMNAVGWGPDRCGAHAEQLMFGPKDRKVTVVDGEPLDVDTWLAIAVSQDIPGRHRGTDAVTVVDLDEPPTERQAARARDILTKSAREVATLTNESGGQSFAGRNNAVARRLPLLYRFVHGGCLDHEDVTETIWEATQVAASKGEYPRSEFDGQAGRFWDLASVDPQRPTVTDAAAEFAPVTVPAALAATSNTVTAPQGPPLAVRLRQHVEAHFDVFPAGDDGRVFVQPKEGGRAELLNGAAVMRAADGVGLLSGSLSAAATEAAKVLNAHAEVGKTRPLSLRVHTEADRIVLDLAQPGTSRCVVVTPAGWTIENVPPEGVTFQAAGAPLPTPEFGGDLEELREVLRWLADDPRWLLVKGWLPCALLADAPRPLLALFGPQGSAKSTTGRFLVDLIDPKPSGALGGGFGKNRADDETKAFGSYLVAWDNVAKMSDDGADFLSRLVTGDMIEKRRLYTDADVVRVNYRRTGVLTGLSLPRGVKSDTLDRLIIVSLDPLEHRASERVLEADWVSVRPRALAGVLDLAVQMLAGAHENPERLRNADYAEALWAIDPDLYRAYEQNVLGARRDRAADDPVLASVLAWLDAEGGEWTGTADSAWAAAEKHQTMEVEWWPRNSRVFSEQITANREVLLAVGVRVERRRSDGVRLLVFTHA